MEKATWLPSGLLAYLYIWKRLQEGFWSDMDETGGVAGC